MNQQVRQEITQLLVADATQLGDTFRLMQEGVTSAADLVAKGAAANQGVISHHKTIIRAVLDGQYPTSSILATYCVRAIKRLLASGIDVSEETRAVLNERRSKLVEIVDDKEAVQRDTTTLLSRAEHLEEKLKKIKNAIYVYTFPTYYRAGIDGDPDFRWLKIGLTTSNVWQRVIDQSRQTSMPEDPIVVRIYYKDGLDLAEVERKFQSTLVRMHHDRSSAKNAKAGKEWFATTEESLDAIAELMGLQIERFEF
jgi:hypothetical protein